MGRSSFVAVVRRGTDDALSWMLRTGDEPQHLTVLLIVPVLVVSLFAADAISKDCLTWYATTWQSFGTIAMHFLHLLSVLCTCALALATPMRPYWAVYPPSNSRWRDKHHIPCFSHNGNSEQTLSTFRPEPIKARNALDVREALEARD